MTFGTAISTYNRKTNPALAKYSAKAKPVAMQAMASSITPTNTNPAKASSSPVPQPNKTALGGANSVIASGAITQPIQGQIFQPQFSGLSSKRGIGPQYSRLNQINQTTDILNQGMQNQIDMRNQEISRRNAMLRNQSSTGEYTGGEQAGGSEFFGIGGEGSGLDNEQLQNARQIANVGRQRGMDDNAIQIALMTSLAESGLRNLNHGDRDSVGLFQQRTSQGWGTTQQIMNPTYSAGKFYDTLRGTNWRGMNPWQAAQAVQRSFDPTGSNYQRQWDLAQRAFRSLSTNPGKANSAAGFIQAYNNKYLDYDGAFGAQCVDLYNFYTARFVGGKNIMVGYAPEIFNAYDTRAYTRLGGNTRGVMGDVAVFRQGPGTPYGHVAIVVGDNGNGTLRVLQSNATAAGAAGNSIISNISKSTLMGYLRPNRSM